MTTERVFMLWPGELKDRVRDLVGARGMSAFVIEAVEDKLRGLDDAPVVVEPETSDDEEVSPPSSLETDVSPEAVEAVPARFDATTREARAAHVEQTFGLRRASKLDPSTTAAPTAMVETTTTEEVDASFCGTCKSPLIAGECWTCNP